MHGSKLAALGVLIALVGAQEAGAQCVASPTNLCVEVVSFSYRFDDGSGQSTADPTLTLNTGQTVTFVMGSSVTSSHPFQLETSGGVALGAADGLSGPNPATAGESLSWTPAAPGTFAYRCFNHPFGGEINVVAALDAGSEDAGELDAGLADAGAADAGAGVLDAGATDAGAADSGIGDAGSINPGQGDAGAGLADAGSTGNADEPPGGCGCSSTQTTSGVLVAFALLVGVQRRRRALERSRA